MTIKVNRTKFYQLVGDVYDLHEQDRSSPHRTHTDNGWRLRSRKYGSGSTFHNVPLMESIAARPCPLKHLDQPGVYILSDSIFPHGFYIGKAKNMSSQIWKHGVKLDGTEEWNIGVEGTEAFTSYRNMRLDKGLTNFDDIQIAFWFTDDYIELEEQLMTAYEYKYGMMPYCNDTFPSADGNIFQVWDI